MSIGCVVMHPEEKHNCATPAPLCIYVDTELCLSIETESVDWWSDLLFIKRKATMVDHEGQKQDRWANLIQTRTFTQHEAQEKPMELHHTRLIQLYNGSKNVDVKSKSLHLVQYQPQMMRQTTNTAPRIPVKFFYSRRMSNVLPVQCV